MQGCESTIDLQPITEKISGYKGCIREILHPYPFKGRKTKVYLLTSDDVRNICCQIEDSYPELKVITTILNDNGNEYIGVWIRGRFFDIPFVRQPVSS